jgi:hypothetical protein
VAAVNGHLISTRPSVRRCPRCGGLILTAVAEGVPAHVDPVPVTVAGEMAALLVGRRSYTLAHGELVTRDVDRVSRPRGAVLVDHRCGQPPATEHRADLPAVRTRTLPAVAAAGLPAPVRAVLDRLTDHGPAMIWQLAKATATPVAAVESALRHLARHGLVERVVAGKPGVPVRWRATTDDQPPY